MNNLHLNPITEGNEEAGIEPIVVKEELPEQMEEEEIPGYNPEGDDPEKDNPIKDQETDITMENYEPSPIQPSMPPIEITPVTSEIPIDTVDPEGLQIKKEMLDTELDPDTIAANCFYGDEKDEEDLDDKISKALANKAESKRIADEKLNLIIPNTPKVGKRGSRNASTASNSSNSSQIASSSNTHYANENQMDTNEGNQPIDPSRNDESDKEEENRNEEKHKKKSGHSHHKKDKKRRNSRNQ